MPYASVCVGKYLESMLSEGVKALTGKTATEWASDMILDTGEDIINSVGNAVTAFAQ